MGNGASQIGLVSYGVYLPAGFWTARELSAASGLSSAEVVGDLGIRTKCRPSAEDQPVPMAVKAALDAFRRAPQVAAEDIDVVIWVGEEYKDYIAQTASIRVQEEVGARRAWAFDLVGQGTTSLLGIRVARDLMVGDPSVRTVLLAGGTRNVDLVDPENPHTRWMLDASASGGALLLSRCHDANPVLSICTLVDSRMADEVFVPGGGTVHPFAVDILGTKQMVFQVTHPDDMETYLAQDVPSRLVEVIRRAMTEGGSPEQRPDYLALRHLGPAGRRQVLAALDLAEESSDDLSDVGHHGPNDVIISLGRGVERDCIRDGSLVVLASAGIGFTYSAALLRWGQKGGGNVCRS
jgi:3-oxoacyl-[acyl-carrier-protein] synthase III